MRLESYEADRSPPRFPPSKLTCNLLYNDSAAHEFRHSCRHYGQLKYTQFVYGIYNTLLMHISYLVDQSDTYRLPSLSGQSSAMQRTLYLFLFCVVMYTIAYTLLSFIDDDNGLDDLEDAKGDPDPTYHLNVDAFNDSEDSMEVDDPPPQDMDPFNLKQSTLARGSYVIGHSKPEKVSSFELKLRYTSGICSKRIPGKYGKRNRATEQVCCRG